MSKSKMTDELGVVTAIRFSTNAIENLCLEMYVNDPHSFDEINACLNNTVEALQRISAALRLNCECPQGWQCCDNGRCMRKCPS